MPDAAPVTVRLTPCQAKILDLACDLAVSRAKRYALPHDARHAVAGIRDAQQAVKRALWEGGKGDGVGDGR